MNADDFETRLKSQPWRAAPAEWRQDILFAARDENRRFVFEMNTASKAPVGALFSWRNWLWPHPVAWAGLAAIWVIVLGLQLTMPRSGTSPWAGSASVPVDPPTPALRTALSDQWKLRNELMGLVVAPDENTARDDHPDTGKPRPRSSRQAGWSHV